MVILEVERTFARGAWGVAVGMILHRDPSCAHLAKEALERPGPESIRALLDASGGKEWRASLIDALVLIGVAGAEDVLG